MVMKEKELAVSFGKLKTIFTVKTTKHGSSNGVNIPKDICESFGIETGQYYTFAIFEPKDLKEKPTE